MERDTFVLEEALLLHESWIYARPDGWHEKKVSVLKGFCLFLMRLHIKGRFLVQKLTSSNVISEFCVIHKANGCECNCCHQWDCSSDFSWIGTRVALARQRFLTFEGTATDSEFPSRSRMLSIFALFSLPPKMFTRPRQDANDLLFLLRAWCNAIRVRTSPDQ